MACVAHTWRLPAAGQAARPAGSPQVADSPAGATTAACTARARSWIAWRTQRWTAGPPARPAGPNPGAHSPSSARCAHSQGPTNGSWLCTRLRQRRNQRPVQLAHHLVHSRSGPQRQHAGKSQLMGRTAHTLPINDMGINFGCPCRPVTARPVRKFDCKIILQRSTDPNMIHSFPIKRGTGLAT